MFVTVKKPLVRHTNRHSNESLSFLNHHFDYTPFYPACFTPFLQVGCVITETQTSHTKQLTKNTVSQQIHQAN